MIKILGIFYFLLSFSLGYFNDKVFIVVDVIIFYLMVVFGVIIVVFMVFAGIILIIIIVAIGMIFSIGYFLFLVVFL